MDKKSLEELNEQFKGDVQTTCNTDDLSGGVSDADANNEADNGQ